MPFFDTAFTNLHARGIYEETCHVSKSAAFRGIVSVGAYSFVGERCWISNSLVGNYSWIENNVELGAKKIFPSSFSNHSFSLSEGNFLFETPEYSKLTTDRFFYHKQPLVYIGSDVRICKGSVIFSGVSLADGVLVLPNSVVYDDAGPYEILAGNPAKVVGHRFPENVIDQLLASNWTSLDFTGLRVEKRKNYMDVDHILEMINSSSLKKRLSKYKAFNSFLKLSDVPVSKVAIQGPSHVFKWVKHIQEKKLDFSDNLMYGEVGVSIFSGAYRNFEKWWLREAENKLIFFVPDFRIGNSGFIGGSERNDGVFIYDRAIDDERDALLYERSIKILDELVEKYGRNIKFIFWCLYGREKTNIKSNKYFEKGQYKHPVWNYSDLREKYKDNIIDIDDFVDNVFEYIDLDGSIHPNLKGFRLLDEVFKNLKW